jgi:hypothetical protein
MGKMADRIKAKQELLFNLRNCSESDGTNKGSTDWYKLLFTNPNVKQLGIYTMTDRVQEWFGKQHAENGTISCLLNHLTMAKDRFKEPLGNQIISMIRMSDDKTGEVRDLYVITEPYRTMTTVCLKEDTVEL